MDDLDVAVQDWNVWLENIYAQVLNLHNRHELHDGMEEMLREQGHPDAEYFWDAFHEMYVESQVLAIRRQADDDPRTLSLRRLLGQVEQNAKRLNRAWYVTWRMEGLDPHDPSEPDRQIAQFHLDQANTD
jgi:hypothetical protein